MLRYTVACKRSYKVKTDDVTLCDIMFMLLYVFSKDQIYIMELY